MNEAYPPKRIRKIVVAGLFVLLASLAGVYVNSGRFVARHVYFHGQLVEGLTRDEAKAIVQTHIDQIKSREFGVQAEQYHEKITPQELGIDFDAEKTVQKLFGIGRSLWLKAQILSDPPDAPHEYYVEPVLEADPEAVKQAVLERLSKSERPFQNASLIWEESDWRIQSALYGRRLAEGEAERITEAILSDMYQLEDEEIRYRVRTEPVPAEREAADLTRMLEQVQALAQDPVTIQAGETIETIPVSQEAGQWFSPNYESKTVEVNRNRVASFVANFAARYDKTPSKVVIKEIRDIESEYAKGETYKKALIEGGFRVGQKVEQDPFIEDLNSVLARPGERKVEVTLLSLNPEIVSEVPGFVFPHRLSRGESSFKLGNRPNRVHNIKRALELEDLTVIPQGELFSYNKVLGWVSYGKGFVDGQVIFGDSLANVPGGGVCQTSTTMYRAAVKAGLPIVERSNHTWDVHYYQDWHGVDAAVYPPGRLDLIFKNDTPGPILVHSYTDDKNEMAYFELYGTSDGRQSTFNTVQNVRQGAGRHIVTDWDVNFADGTTENRQIVSHYRR